MPPTEVDDVRATRPDTDPARAPDTDEAIVRALAGCDSVFVLIDDWSSNVVCAMCATRFRDADAASETALHPAECPWRRAVERYPDAR